MSKDASPSSGDNEPRAHSLCDRILRTRTSGIEERDRQKRINVLNRTSC